MTDLRLTLRGRKGSPLTSNEADADLQYLAQLSVPKWSLTDAAIAGAYTNGIIVDSAVTGNRYQLNTGGTPTVNPDVDGPGVHWTQVGSSGDSLVEARATNPTGTPPSAGKILAVFNGGLYTVQGGVYALASGDTSPVDATLTVDPTGTAPAAGKSVAIFDEKWYVVDTATGFYKEYIVDDVQARIDAAENYTPIQQPDNARVGAVDPTDWPVPGTETLGDAIEYLYPNGSSDVFFYGVASWSPAPIYRPKVETDERINISPLGFLYPSTPRQSDFQDWLNNDIATTQDAGPGDTIQAITAEGHVFRTTVKADRVTAALILSDVEAVIPFGSELLTLPTNLNQWAPDWIISTQRDTGDAPAGDYVMNTNNTGWLPTQRLNNYLGGGGSTIQGISQADLDLALQDTLRDWLPGNTSDRVLTTIYALDGITSIFEGLATLRTGGNRTIDPSNTATGGPTNWRLDMNRTVTWHAQLGPYIDPGDRVYHAGLTYEARAGGNFSVDPTGATDINWTLL